MIDNKEDFYFYIFSRTTTRTNTASKGMKLGTKGKSVESFVDQLKSEGEIVANTVPVTTGAGGAVAKHKTQSSMPETAQGE